MKVCNLYGDGFYYIPGTQTCMKIGGFLRTEVDFHAQGSFVPEIQTNSLNIRPQDSGAVRSRGIVTFDVREQTTWGTLRAYLAGGWQYTTNDAPTLSLPGGTVAATGGGTVFNAADNSNTWLLRAFIQLGGFTLGKTASFYDFFNTSKYSLQTNFIYQDYAGVGVNTWGYTQQFGNGTAGTIALQDPSNFEKPVVDLNNNPFQVPGTGPTNSGHNNAGFLVPDIVASLRVDQAWGGAQIAGILHDNRATQFTNVGGAATAYPGDKWGGAISGGLDLNLANWGWAKGDSFGVQSRYCVGDSESCYNNSGTQFSDIAWTLQNTGKIGIAWVDDAYYVRVGPLGIPNISTITGAQSTGLQLPTMWNIWAAIQHYWVPDVRTSLYGGYVTYKANSSAVDQQVCAGLHAGGSLLNLKGSSAVSPTGCADWNAWAIGSRTIWNPVKNLDVGVDVLYTQLAKSAFQGATITYTAAQGPATTVTVGSTHVVAGIVRVQYNFYP